MDFSSKEGTDARPHTHIGMRASDHFSENEPHARAHEGRPNACRTLRSWRIADSSTLALPRSSGS